MRKKGKTGQFGYRRQFVLYFPTNALTYMNCKIVKNTLKI